MTQINDNLYVNANNIVYATIITTLDNINEYWLTLTNGNSIQVTQEVFEGFIGE